MNKKLLITAGVFVTVSLFFIGCGGKRIKSVQDYSITQESYQKTPRPEGIEGLEPYSWCYYGESSDLSGFDFSDNSDLLKSLCFTNYTKFPDQSKMPEDCSPEELIEWGKYPGLHMDVLFQNGLNGKGATVAIIDQPCLTTHEAFSDLNIEYLDLVGEEETGGYNSMHGPSVLSLLAGKEIGTAPEAKVYFVEDASWRQDEQVTADAIQKLIDINETLPNEEKISMISISDKTGKENQKNSGAFEKAIKKANKAGIWVWTVRDPLKLNDVMFLPLSDRNDPTNLVKDAHSNATEWTDISWNNVLSVPAGGRTAAYTLGGHDDEYVFWSFGGVSWSAPYLTGIVATAHQIAPELSQQDMIDILLKTAYTANELTIINPVGFMAEVLKESGDVELSNKILKEAGFKS